eukprot:CAMPEP_0203702740 /NCGR_PEP_ID=MMETSP0091-20130426/40558_1 /ASSEMBLY_ACC=CAM_ASM_001089 /TAXON_ID=426623 /ORGANISM="Chaetoceros affinis, Strain CCMP159" /LENGTH=201 /DNA_ID=CAMNT_0050577041 /DNA_START=157 /DNA_END=762 /DNA_ORIENTATION=+
MSTNVSNENTKHNTGGNGDDSSKVDDDQLVFGRFRISSEQIFYKSPSNLSAGIVNLRPIVPGHVLIIPRRIVPKISELDKTEYIDLWDSVRIVQNMLEAHYDAQGFNIAIQDGRAAGQSVPHVHVHILPRVTNDFERNDDVYDRLEEWAPSDKFVAMKKEEKERNGNSLHVPDDEDRKDRTMKEMEDEALTYRSLLCDSML